MTERRKRVFFLNNYDATSVPDRIERGEYPAQHLWGVWELRTAYDWQIPPHSVSTLAWRRPRLAAWLRRLSPLVGDVLQEWYVLRHLQPGDVIYAADQQSAALLGALSRLGALRRRRLLVMVHNGPRLRWTRWWMGGADHLFCLSEGIKDRLAAQGLPAHVMPWGPSLDSPIYTRQKRLRPDLDFVAAGKINRDYEQLRVAARRGSLNGVIFSPDGVERYAEGRVTTTAASGTYREVIAAVAASRAVVIPLADVHRLSGLTQAADALALDIPLIVTDTDLFPYFGDEVTRLSPQATADEIGNAISRTTRPAGQAARQPRWNMRAFAGELARSIDAP